MIEPRKLSDRELYMEVLCTLPKFPLKMNVFDLAKDFGVSDSKIIRSLNEAKHKNMPVKFNEVAGEACINASGWKRMQVLTDGMWIKLRGMESP